MMIREEKAFTFVEMLIVLIISSLLFTILASFQMFMSREQIHMRNRFLLSGNAMSAIEDMRSQVNRASHISLPVKGGSGSELMGVYGADPLNLANSLISGNSLIGDVGYFYYCVSSTTVLYKYLGPLPEPAIGAIVCGSAAVGGSHLRATLVGDKNITAAVVFSRDSTVSNVVNATYDFRASTKEDEKISGKFSAISQEPVGL